LLNGETLAVLYPTLIFADFPGAIGAWLNSGVVHPQAGFTLEIIRGLSPVLVTVKNLVPSEFGLI